MPTNLESLEKICDAKDCEKRAKADLGRFRLCVEHYTSVVYDMVPLLLKEYTDDQS